MILRSYIISHFPFFHQDSRIFLYPPCVEIELMVCFSLIIIVVGGGGAAAVVYVCVNVYF